MARPWRRSTKISLGIWGLVVALQVAAVLAAYIVFTVP